MLAFFRSCPMVKDNNMKIPYRVKDITGKKFNRLTIKSFAYTDRQAYWNCICDCGNMITLRGASIRNGRTKSCGCLHHEIMKKQFYKHGMVHTKVYNTYQGILRRCNRRNGRDYENYRGRGIRCLWKSFEEFYRDMGDPPSRHHSIDRIDNDGNYCKINCRWATPEQQSNNRRMCRQIFYRGRTQTISRWAKELGIKYHRLYGRFWYGMSAEKAFSFK